MSAEARMHHDAPPVRVETADGVATLWLEFPGTPVNALSPARLAAVDRALAAILPNPHVELLVVRSGRPAGFCGGHHLAVVAALESDGDRAAFAVAGQQVLRRLATAAVPSVAFLDGPCLGPGLELALACDYRLAVAGPDAWLGFPAARHGSPPCWGGTARLTRLVGRTTASRLLGGDPVTAREARAAGLVDDAFCARRGKIELRGFLDRLQRRPRKRGRTADVCGAMLAAERLAFRLAVPLEAVPRIDQRTSPFPLPDVVAVAGGDGVAGRLAVECALRGRRVVTSAGAPVSAALDAALRRGRVTPLEAEQTRQRVRPDDAPDGLDSGGLVVVTDPTLFLPPEPRLLPRAVLAVPSARLTILSRHATHPGRVVGLDFDNDAVVISPSPRTTADTVASLAAWLSTLGFVPSVVERPAALPASRAA